MIEAFYTDAPQQVELRSLLPLSYTGLAVPGPHFLAHAASLGDDAIQVDGKGAYAHLERYGPILEELIRGAVYGPNFHMPVLVKKRPAQVQFIPGHIWGASQANGPRPARVCVIGKWPGRDEMASRRNLVGPSGQILVEALERAGVQRSDYQSWYVTNVVKFMNPDPTTTKMPTAYLKDGLHVLQQELAVVQPEYILCLGTEASQTVLGNLAGGLTAMQGRQMPVKVTRISGDVYEAKAMACIHPASVARAPDMTDTFQDGIRQFAHMLTGQAARSRKLQWEAVQTEERLRQLVDQAIEESRTDPACNTIAVDCEWNGDYPTERNAWLRTLQFSYRPGQAVVVVFREQGGASAFQPSIEAAVPHLQRLLVDTPERRVRIVGHGLRADLPWIREKLSVELGDQLIRQFEAPQDDAEPDGVTRLLGWQKTATEGGFDTMLGVHSVQEVAGPGGFKLEVCALAYCGIPRYDDALLRWKKNYCQAKGISEDDLEGYGDCPSEVLYPYGAWDAAATRELMEVLNRPDGLLDKDRFGNNARIPFWIAMRASPACLEAEMRGMLVDPLIESELCEVYRRVSARLLAEFREKASWPDFNPASIYHSRAVLFGDAMARKPAKEGGWSPVAPAGAITLNLRPLVTAGDVKKNWDAVERRGEAHLYAPCTDRETLGILATRMPIETEGQRAARDLVVRLRHLRFISKVLTQQLRPAVKAKEKEFDDSGVPIRGLLSWTHADGRIRTHIYQTKETGRYSSARPPLQNLSKRREKDYREILGKDYARPLRAIFRTTPGYLMVEADYIGAELNMLAIQCGSAKMIEHCRRAGLPEGHPDGYDIHSTLAVQAFRLNCPPTKKAVQEKYPGMRDVAKTIVFGLPYGRGDEAILRGIEEEGVRVTADQVRAVRSAIFETYPEIEPYLAACHERPVRPGYMVNCYGRYRRFPVVTDEAALKSMERQAGNFGIQGGVADLVNQAMDALYVCPRRDERGLWYHIILQIHDAILFEVRADRLLWFLGTEASPGIVHQCMSQVAVWPCDLDGFVKPGASPHYMPIETAIYANWGVKLSRQEGLQLGVPELYLPKEKK